MIRFVTGAWNWFRGRDPIPGFIATMQEVKELKEAYKLENQELHMRIVDLERRLNASEKSELDCLYRMQELRIDIRNIAEELLILRGRQDKNEK